MAEIRQKIVPHLWYDRQAREAAGFYASVFPNSAVGNITRIHDTPSGDCDVVSFEVWKQDFMAISAGPLFSFNPSISFLVNFDPLFFGDSPSAKEKAREKLAQVWARLSEGGMALMPLGEYPFSERYGWIQDKYGVSWQLILPDPEGEPRPPIVPFLLFVGENCGRAEEAIDFYLSVFGDSRQGKLVRHGAGQAPDREGTVMFADFMLENGWFAAMDSAHDHGFNFNEALSFVIYCDDQREIDGYWEKLSAVPEAEQCGWLKDKYGVSWQVVPADMDEMMRNGSREQVARLTRAFLAMKKFDLAALRKAYAGR
ncbi:VOC family protein [Microbulbifer litoralis]|uniref:VOC family protein n=1 Tax=Microbulbifer litoralis TaxID=2933965 RepID=UPI002027F0CB|nr:VOC family protein [Microbulbifer sp. GX H0434]